MIADMKDNKIEKNKSQYNLNRQTGKILASSSGNVRKYGFLTEILPEKGILEKTATIKNLNIHN